MAEVKLIDIQKIYDNNVQAVFDFNLEIKDHEFIVFVGPSGCGKSTTLRMIAGLEEISSGDLLIDGERMNDVEPKDRNIAMVFQSYALYPHMTVFDNMAFGLKLRKVPKEEIKRRVEEAGEILGLTQYLDRKPKALSGGQRQRVALGRAIVREAKIFLMDEPLSNLDAKLRVTMRSEIVNIHEKMNATTIYVTHDQTEAMTMATRIVVMKDGYIQQIGTPTEIYNHPANVFVAEFTGSPAMNILKATFDGTNVVVDGKEIPVQESRIKDLEAYIGKEILVGIRPENISADKAIIDTYPYASFPFYVDLAELLGHETIIHTTIGGQKLLSKVNSRNDVRSKTEERLGFDVNKLHFFDPETTKVIK